MIYIQRDNVIYSPYSETEAFEHFKAEQLLQSDPASTNGKGIRFHSRDNTTSGYTDV